MIQKLLVNDGSFSGRLGLNYCRSFETTLEVCWESGGVVTVLYLHPLHPRISTDRGSFS